MSGSPDEHRHLPAWAVEVRFDDLQGESGGHGSVEGIAAALEHRHPDRRRDPVGGSHHAEVAGQFGPRRHHGSHLAGPASRLSLPHEAARTAAVGTWPAWRGPLRSDR
jgi:hypothetical protein